MDWGARLIDLFVHTEATAESTTERDRSFLRRATSLSSRVGYSPTRNERARIRRIYRKVFG